MNDYHKYEVCGLGGGIYGDFDKLKDARAKARDLEKNGDTDNGVTYKVENLKVYPIDKYGCRVYRNLYHG
jgi:hypothetical protein